MQMNIDQRILEMSVGHHVPSRLYRCHDFRPIHTVQPPDLVGFGVEIGGNIIPSFTVSQR